MISLRRMRGSGVGVLEGTGAAGGGVVGSAVAVGVSAEVLSGVNVAVAVADGSSAAVVPAVGEGVDVPVGGRGVDAGNVAVVAGVRLNGSVPVGVGVLVSVGVGVLVSVGVGSGRVGIGVGAAQTFAGVLLLRGDGTPRMKSTLLSFVSLQPPAWRRSAFVLEPVVDGAVSNSSALPYPSRSSTRSPARTRSLPLSAVILRSKLLSGAGSAAPDEPPLS